MAHFMRQLKRIFLGRKAIITPSNYIQKNWKDSDIPRYPPFMKGLPAVPTYKVIRTQSELIKRIRQSVKINTDCFDRYYLSIIRRFCDYVHLLPASQSHHHRGAGGLFRHSLEVGLYALQAAEKVLIDLGKTPADNREIEPRWQLAVFLGALCHDVGKPVTDLSISNGDRTIIWKPIQENLYSWTERCRVDAYFLDWREGRGSQHTSMANLVADRIIGTDSLMWLEEGGLELVLWLMESLNGNPSPVNPLHTIVIQADRVSVERDLKTMGATMAGYDIGVPVERLLIDVMQRLVKEGIWQVNEPGARVWKLAGDTYVVWPAGGEEMARIIRDEKIPGLARTAEGILDMLRERNLVHVPEDTKAPFWYVIPELLKQKIPAIRLQVIRLVNDSQVSSLPLQEVAGIVCGVNDHQQNSTEEINTDTDEDTQQTTPAVGELTETETGKKAVASRSNEDIQVSKPINDHVQDSIQLDEEVGDIIQFLLNLLKTGEREWGNDVWIDEEGYLLVKWPEALHGFELSSRDILEKLSQWLWVDPVTPWKKVVESKLNDQQVKTLRIKKEVCQFVAKQFKSAELERSNSTNKSLNSEEANINTSDSGSSKSKNEFPTLEELTNVLQAFEKDSLDEKGWSSMNRKLLSKGIRDAGYRCTIVFLKEFAKKHPDHFSLAGMNFRWRL